MKNVVSIGLFISIIMMSSAFCVASADSKYPADFEPYIVYQDQELINLLEKRHTSPNKSRVTGKTEIDTINPEPGKQNIPATSKPPIPVSAESNSLPLTTLGVVGALILALFWMTRGKAGIEEDEPSVDPIIDQNTPKFLVKARWDRQIKAWIATSDDVPGLSIKVETTEALIQQLNTAIPALLDSNGIEYSTPIAFQLQSEMVGLLE